MDSDGIPLEPRSAAAIVRAVETKAVVGIMNSILFSVQDRIRDFGTLRAIAFTGNGVSAIIAVEALLLGVCASFLAVLAALYPMGMVKKMSIREALGSV